MDDLQLYFHGTEIRDGRKRGLWVPIMRHLMLRGSTDAMIELAHWYTDGNNPRDLDGIGDPYSAANLYYRVWRKGGSDGARAAHSFALSYFNCGDLLRFRLWAHRGARLGDYSCRFYIKHFETRLPHANARKIRRHRPEGKRDQWA